MSQDLTTTLVAGGASIVGGAFGAWVAARFSLKHYFSQRLWDRRAEAYTAIFAALHRQADWFDKNIEDLIHDRDASPEELGERVAAYRKAAEEMRERLARETWLIPDDTRLRLKRLSSDLRRPEQNASWSIMLLRGRDAIEEAIDDLRRLARQDLNVS